MDVTESTEVVTAVEWKDGAYVVSVGREGIGGVIPFQMIEVSSRGLLRVKSGTEETDSPRCLLRLPARVGDTWVFDAQLGHGPATKYATKGEEEVEVSAGKFTTIRVEGDWEYGKGPIRIIEWYAPGVGRVKRVAKSPDFERVVVLKSFTPGKD
jgi:hypothetical protein